jgi:hypothetical protein
MPDSWPGLVRYVFAIGLAGLITGVLVAGIGSRLVMRLSSLISPDVSGTGVRTEQGFRVGEVTLSGTIELIVFVGIFTGLFGAVYYAVARPWLLRFGRWHGAAFGVLLFLIGSATSDVFNTDNPDFVILDMIPVTATAFIALFVLFGVVISTLFGWLDRRLPAAEGSKPMLGVYLIPTIFPGLFILPGAMVMLVTDEGCGCDPPIVAGVAFVVLAVITIALWFLGRRATEHRIVRGLVAVGWVSLAVAAIAGAWRAISDLAAII